jgi:hypothetical protein
VTAALGFTLEALTVKIALPPLVTLLGETENVILGIAGGSAVVSPSRSE